MPRGPGRDGRPWRRAAKAARAASDLCWLCGHHGARQVDHDPPLVELKQQGLDPNDPRFHKIAHGGGNAQTDNPCPTCHRRCNQVKGVKRTLPKPRGSRAW
jgi:hypothetical protein